MVDEIGNAGEVKATEAVKQPKQASPKKAKKVSKPTPKVKASKPTAKPKKAKKSNAASDALKTFPNFDMTSPDEEVDKKCRESEDEMGDTFSTMQGDSDKAMDDAFADSDVF